MDNYSFRCKPGYVPFFVADEKRDIVPVKYDSDIGRSVELFHYVFNRVYEYPGLDEETVCRMIIAACYHIPYEFVIGQTYVGHFYSVLYGLFVNMAGAAEHLIEICRDKFP